MQRTDLECLSRQQWDSEQPLRAIVRCCAAVLVLVVLAVPAHAQYRTSIQGTVADPQGAVIPGTVADPQGAVIPGATLTLTNKSTNETEVRTSNGEGIFNFNALPADHFTLVVERQ